MAIYLNSLAYFVSSMLRDMTSPELCGAGVLFSGGVPSPETSLVAQKS